MIELAIIEDDPTIRKNIEIFAGFNEDIRISCASASVESFLDKLKGNQLKPDVLLLDIGLPGMSGLDGIKSIKKLLPELDIIMLTTYEDEDKIVRALSTGACSYLSKKTSLDEIMNTVKIVYNGGSYMSPAIARKLTTYMLSGQKEKNLNLTTKQEEVIKGLVDGLSYKGLAEKLGVSVETIKTHIKRIYQTLHVNSKAEAVAKYLNS